MHSKIALSGEDWSRSLDAGVDFLQHHRGFLFCAYPDADAVGSMLALALHLKQVGKQSWLLKPGPLHDNLDFLFGILQHNGIPVLNCPADIVETAGSIDAVVFCDTATRKLIPHFESLSRHLLEPGRAVLEIDHHFGTDAEALTPHGLHLFRKSNATAEIAAELLDRYAQRHPDTPNPFHQRNILVSLLTGLITDTGGGRASVEPRDYAYWTTRLGEQLQDQTRSRVGDNDIPHFENPDEIQEFLHRITEQEAAWIDILKPFVVKAQGIGRLVLLDSAMRDVEAKCPVTAPEDFAQARELMANIVAEMAAGVGLLVYRDKTAQGEDCVYLKLRCAPGCPADLRNLEPAIREAFGEHRLLGGGGHPGAVSFRIQSEPEAQLLQALDRFLPRIQQGLNLPS